MRTASLKNAAGLDFNGLQEIENPEKEVFLT